MVVADKIAGRLRNTIQDIRRKPYPIKDLIPLMSEAADELENQRRALKYEIDLCEQAIASRKLMEDFLEDLFKTTSDWTTQDKLKKFFKTQNDW